MSPKYASGHKLFQCPVKQWASPCNSLIGFQKHPNQKVPSCQKATGGKVAANQFGWGGALKAEKAWDGKPKHISVDDSHPETLLGWRSCR